MGDSTVILDQISTSQAQKEVTANELFDALSPTSVYGRHASACAGLTWGYYGGKVNIAGTITSISNGTLTLSGSATNYVEADGATGGVSSNTSGFTAGRVRLYTVVCGSSTVTSYTDHRTSAVGFLNAAPASTILVNAQTGTSYTVLTTDRSKLVTLSNASAVAVTLPQAGSSFPSGWFAHLQNRGAGLVTITPTTSTIDGASSLTLRQDEGALIVSDGSNYYTARGRARQLPFIVVSVAYAATTTVDLSAYSRWATVILDLTLTGNVTFNITNGTDGQVIKLRCRQDATGSRLWTSGANIRISADISSIVLSTAASKLDYIGFEWNGTDGKADVLAINKGF